MQNNLSNQNTDIKDPIKEIVPEPVISQTTGVQIEQNRILSQTLDPKDTSSIHNSEDQAQEKFIPQEAPKVAVAGRTKKMSVLFILAFIVVLLSFITMTTILTMSFLTGELLLPKLPF